MIGKLVPGIKFDAVLPEQLDSHVSASYSTVLAMQPKVSPIAQARQAVSDAPAVQPKADDMWTPSDDPETARQRMVARMLDENKPAHLKRHRS